MFSLIISIIAIALVAALAGASVYYGGSAFNKGTAGADASAFMNAGQQINGAFALATSDGYSPSDVASLSNSLLDGDDTDDKDVYLTQSPSYKGAALTLDGTNADYVSVTVSQAVADELTNNRNAQVVDGTTVTAPTQLLAVEGTTAYYKVK